MNLSVESLAQIGQVPARQHVSLAVHAAREPFNAGQLLQYLRQSGARISYTSIYRNLALLIRAGEITRVVLANGEAVHFPADGHGRTLWICSVCGLIRTLRDETSATVLRKRIQKEGLFVGAALVQIQSECSDQDACRDRLSSHPDGRSLEYIWPSAASSAP
jgi:Fe2+ or Zn2+ uptake regulation protein